MFSDAQLKFLSLNVRGLNNQVKHVAIYSFATNKSKVVAIICCRNLHFKLLDTWTDNKERIAIAMVHIGKRDIAFVSIYAPNAFDEEFYELVTKVLLRLSGFKFIAGADYNAVMDHSLDRSGQSGNTGQKQASKALRSWTNSIGVVDLWRLLNHNIKDFTHLSARHKSFS